MGRSDRKKSRKLWLKIPIIVIILLILGVGVYAFTVYNNAKSTVNDKMQSQVDSIDTSLTKKKLNETEALNVLLLGIDSEEDQAGRSDAMMIMRLYPETDEMKIVSIPRDTRAEIVGKDKEDKINHAYAFGKEDMAVATVENFLDIELDYYVAINIDGLVELVDELGYITVDNEVEWSDNGYDFPTGTGEMDGDKTMSYVRMRKEDPEGDFGRTTRQRKVIEGILQEGASAGSVPKIKSLTEVLGNNMSTNMDFADMKKLFSGYRDTRRNVDEYMLDGEGTNIDGVYYLQVPDEEIQKGHDILTEDES